MRQLELSSEAVKKSHKPEFQDFDLLRQLILQAKIETNRLNMVPTPPPFILLFFSRG
jgi:hypothetical protein